MGASVPNIPAEFKSAEVISLLYFTVDNSEYHILRNHDQFTLFHGQVKKLQTSHVTSELAPFFADLFNFKLQLRSHQSEFLQATPSFLFLPFYLDQDQGWHKTFESFSDLRQFSNWTKDFLYFHLGICPSEYYDKKDQKSRLEKQLADSQTKADVIRRTQGSIDQAINLPIFDINLEDYQSAIANLITEANRLKQKEDDYLKKRFEINDEYRILCLQKRILEKARIELQKDFTYSTDKLPDVVECPICHAQHDNSFAIRFNLAFDEYRCTEILQEIETKLIDCQKKLLDLESDISSCNADIVKINRCLDYTQNAISLDDVINISGRKQVNAILDNELATINSQQTKIKSEIAECVEELDKILNRDLQNRIQEEFSNQIKSNYRKLSLSQWAAQHKGIKCECNTESGSVRTRMIFGYFLALISIIKKRSTACFCPIVIDSPRQNDVDSPNWKLMLELLKEELPTESQCIMSLIEHDGVDYEGEEIVLDNARHLLNTNDFSEAYSAIIALENNNIQPELGF